MATPNQVSSAEMTANTHATNKGKLGFVKQCNDTTKQRTDVVKPGEIYFLLYNLNIINTDIL